MSKFILKFLWIVGLSLLVACSGTAAKKNDFKATKNKQTQEEHSVEEYYSQALVHMEDQRYSKAIEIYEYIEQRFPYSSWAVRGQIMSAYAHYKQEEYETALTVLDHFISLYPGNDNISYAYYLKALCYYDQITDVGRDQHITRQALVALQEVMARFPSTDYAKDAHLKLDLVQDHLAGKEMEIGRFYQKQGKLVAAINRYKTVVDEYQRTTHIGEALFRLSESYIQLGVVDEAQKYAAVLGHNYPDSKWYKYTYRLFD